MKVVLSDVISPNGLIARENGEEDWLPIEGWYEFCERAKDFNNVVMGRETYELVMQPHRTNNFNGVETGYKVVVTRNTDFVAPDGYTVVHSPEEAITFLEGQELERLLLIGGGKLNTEFIKRKLINEMWLTITPYIIGRGRPFISPDEFDLPLTFMGQETLPKGRLLLKYKVNNSQ